jgi:hypothetical protein
MIGEMPPGALPSCPYCHTVFQLPPPESDVSAPESPAPLLEARPSRRRAKRSRRSLGWIVLLLAICGGAGAVYVAQRLMVAPEKKPSGTDPPRPKMQGTWETVGTWSGSANKKTPPFRVVHGTWRVHWSCSQRPGKRDKRFNVYVYDAASGRLHSNPITSSGEGRDTTWLNTEPGNYYLEIRASDMDWEVSVEDQR